MRTVFIVGAGASTEFQLPLGEALVFEIRETLKNEFLAPNPTGDGILTSAVSAIAGSDMDRWRSAARHLYAGLLNSNTIDQFLHTHRQFPDACLLGKMAIVAGILKGERQTNCRPIGTTRDHGEFLTASKCAASVLTSTWIGRIFRAYTDGIAPHDLAGAFSDVAFVTFNYDRCIEFFLFHLLTLVGQAKPEEARQILSSVPILHAYGSLGPLPEMGLQPALGYGEPSCDAHSIVSKVKTFREELDLDTQVTNAIRKEIAEAGRIVFLGFGFAPENLALLNPGAAPFSADLFGTALGYTNESFEPLRHTLFPPRTFTDQFARLKCTEYLDRYMPLILSRKTRSLQGLDARKMRQALDGR